MSHAPARPSTLAELRVGLIAGEEFGPSIERVCDAHRLSPDSCLSAIEHERFDLVLVTSEPGWRQVVPNLLQVCSEQGIPTVQWITSAALTADISEHAALFDRVFVVDYKHIEALRTITTEVPSLLPFGCRGPVNGHHDGSPRPIPVAWIGQWSDSWPRAGAEALSMILAAAASRGLRIAAVEDAQPPGTSFPPELEPFVESMTAGEMMSRARVVIAVDPSRASGTTVPPLVFDALAHGAAVIAKRGWAVKNTLRNLVDLANSRDDATSALGRLLEDEDQRLSRVKEAQRVLRYNHTFGHRLATIASAVGYHVVPDMR